MDEDARDEDATHEGATHEDATLALSSFRLFRCQLKHTLEKT